MFDIRDFCHLINADKPDIFEMCKHQNIIPEFSKSLKDLLPNEVQAYQKEVEFYLNSYRIIWKDIIIKYIKY